MRPIDLILWGGTGQARVLTELVGQRYRVVAVVDRALEKSPIADVPLLRDEADVERWLREWPGDRRELSGAVAIGGNNGVERKRIGDFFASIDVATPQLIHATAIVAANCEIGRGSQILLGAIVGVGARVGEFVILNTGAQIDHDCVVEAGAHLAPGVVAAGEARIGENAFVGTGAVIHPRVTLGSGCVVAAGAIVTADVAPGVTVAGVPARPLRSDNQF